MNPEIEYVRDGFKTTPVVSAGHMHIGPTSRLSGSSHVITPSTTSMTTSWFESPIQVGKPVEKTFDDVYESFTRWMAEFRPIPNSFRKSDGSPEFFFSASSEEDLLKVRRKSPDQVWTHLEDDAQGISYIVNGYERSDLNEHVVGYYIVGTRCTNYPGTLRVASNYISDCTMCQGQDMDCLDCLGMNFVETHFFDI